MIFDDNNDDIIASSPTLSDPPLPSPIVPVSASQNDLCLTYMQSVSEANKLLNCCHFAILIDCLQHLRRHTRMQLFLRKVLLLHQ